MGGVIKAQNIMEEMCVYKAIHIFIASNVMEDSQDIKEWKSNSPDEETSDDLSQKTKKTLDQI